MIQACSNQREKGKSRIKMTTGMGGVTTVGSRSEKTVKAPPERRKTDELSSRVKVSAAAATILSGGRSTHREERALEKS